MLTNSVIPKNSVQLQSMKRMLLDSGKCFNKNESTAMDKCYVTCMF